MEKIDICIIGAGPSGIATAAALMRLNPSLRDHLVILEKAEHPRHKLCGGGLRSANFSLRRCKLKLALR